MDEHAERSARTMHDEVEHLTFAEAAERLNISPNAVRMRVHRGSLASVRENDRTFVVWPQPDQAHAQHDERTRVEHRAPVHDARLIETLQAEVTYLRGALDAEIEARRRADHLISDLVRMQALPAVIDVQGVPQDGDPGSQRGDMGAESQLLHPSPAPQESPLRRWWRQFTGGD